MAVWVTECGKYPEHLVQYRHVIKWKWHDCRVHTQWITICRNYALNNMRGNSKKIRGAFVQHNSAVSRTAKRRTECVFMTFECGLPKLVAAHVIIVGTEIFQNKITILVSHVCHVPFWLPQLLERQKQTLTKTPVRTLCAVLIHWTCLTAIQPVQNMFESSGGRKIQIFYSRKIITANFKNVLLHICNFKNYM